VKHKEAHSFGSLFLSKFPPPHEVCFARCWRSTNNTTSHITNTRQKNFCLLFCPMTLKQVKLLIIYSLFWNE